MSLQEHLHTRQLACLEVHREATSQLAEPISRAAQLIVDSLMREGKILACGQTGSLGLARLFAALLTQQHQLARPGLAAIALQSGELAEEAGTGYARQVDSLGRAGDVLLLISSSGTSTALLGALHHAHDQGMGVVVLTAGDGGQLAEALLEEDAVICTPALSVAHTREFHLRAIHSLCDGIDFLLLGA